MSDAFNVGINFPLSNSDSKYGPVLKGTAMTVLSFLVIPWFALFGYSLRLRESAARGDEEAPAFDEWAKLTKEGFFGVLAISRC